MQEELLRVLIRNKKFESLVEYMGIKYPGKSILFSEYTSNDMRYLPTHNGLHVLCPRNMTVVQEGNLAHALMGGDIFDKEEEIENASTYVMMKSLPYTAMHQNDISDRKVGMFEKSILGKVSNDGSVANGEDIQNGITGLRDIFDVNRDGILDKKETSDKTKEVVCHHTGVEDYWELPQDVRDELMGLDIDVDNIRSSPDDAIIDEDDWTDPFKNLPKYDDFPKDDEELIESDDLDMERDDVGGEEEYEDIQEGFRETLQKAGSVAKKFTDKITSLINVRQNLKNLQLMDKPNAIRKYSSIGLTLPGTNIPIFPKNTKTFREYYKNNETHHHSYYQESVFGMSSNDIKNISNSFSKKHGVPVVFSDIGKSFGGAGVVAINPEKFKQLKNNNLKIQDIINTSIADDTEIANAEKVIIISPRTLTEIVHQKKNGSLSKENILTILEHEYGHVKTFSKLSSDDWFEYLVKVSQISSIGIMLNLTMPQLQNYYWDLKPEALANQAAGITKNQLSVAYFGQSVQTTNVIDMNAVVSIKLPDIVKKPQIQAAKDGRSLSMKELVDIVEWSKVFYNKIVKDKSVLKLILDGIDDQIKMIKDDTGIQESYYKKPKLFESPIPEREFIESYDPEYFVIQEGLFKRKPKRLKPIGRDLIAYIVTSINEVEDTNDQAMLSGYICSKLELVDFYLTVLETEDARYIVPHPRGYLVSMQKQLEDLLKTVLKIKPINRNDKVWRVNVNYPDGFGG